MFPLTLFNAPHGSWFDPMARQWLNIPQAKACQRMRSVVSHWESPNPPRRHRVGNVLAGGIVALQWLPSVLKDSVARFDSASANSNDYSKERGNGFKSFQEYVYALSLALGKAKVTHDTIK